MAIQLKLKKIREASAISQYELAVRTGMSPQNIAKLEQGRSKGIQFDTLERLCRVLNAEIQDLLVLTANDQDGQFNPSEERSLNDH